MPLTPAHRPFERTSAVHAEGRLSKGGFSFHFSSPLDMIEAVVRARVGCGWGRLGGVRRTEDNTSR